MYLLDIVKLSGMIFGGIGVLFMLFTFVFNVYRMWKDKNDKLKDKIETKTDQFETERRSITSETTRWVVAEFKSVNEKLEKIFGLVTDLRLHQKDIQIMLNAEFLRKKEHEVICDERRK